MRFGLKRKKENEFSFYTLHPNQLLSEVLFTTAGLFLKTLRSLAFSAPLRLNLLFWHFGVQHFLFICSAVPMFLVQSSAVPLFWFRVFIRSIRWMNRLRLFPSEIIFTLRSKEWLIKKSTDKKD